VPLKITPRTAEVASQLKAYVADQQNEGLIYMKGNHKSNKSVKHNMDLVGLSWPRAARLHAEPAADQI
jgi:hypothetical protein